MKKKDRSTAFENSENELNDAELQMLRSRVDELGDRSIIPPPERKKQNKLIKFAKNNTVATVVVSVLVVALISAFILLGIYLGGGENHNDFRFVYGEGAKAEEIKVKYEDIVINDILYVDMNKLAEFAGLSVSGSEESMKYIGADDNYIKFTHEAEYAIINTARIVLPEGQTAIIGGGRCLVPYQVISKAVSGGILFKMDQSKNIVTIKRATYTVDDVVYNDDVTFTSAKFEVAKTAVYEYDIDIEQYLEYIAPEDPTPYLLLVNPSNTLSEDYIPDTLTRIPSTYTAKGAEYELEACAREALVAMMKEMYHDLAATRHAYVTSAYRSYSRQNKLFEGYIDDYVKAGVSREDAEAIVLETSARPGTSEHQSGLCVDFMTLNMTSLNNSFEQSSAFEWLSDNAYKFGFILRYPADKGDIVAHSYESWHYRFVGREAATEMYLSGICLEEYLEIKPL